MKKEIKNTVILSILAIAIIFPTIFCLSVDNIHSDLVLFAGFIGMLLSHGYVWIFGVANGFISL